MGRKDLILGVFLTEVSQKIVGQWNNVLPPLPQGRQTDGNDVEPIVKISPELFGLHQLGQVLIGGGDQPEVYWNGVGGADALNSLGFDGPEDLALEVEGHGIDLIQEKGAALGCLKQAFFSAGSGSGKGPLFIAEQLCLQQIFWQGSAVDYHQGLLAAGAGGVNIIGYDFLASTRFSQQEHSRIHLRHSGGDVQHGAHGAALRHDGGGGGVLGAAPGKGGYDRILAGLLIQVIEFIQGLYHSQDIAHLTALVKDGGGGNDLPDGAAAIILGIPDILKHYHLAFFQIDNVGDTPVNLPGGQKIVDVVAQEYALGHIQQLRRRC